MMRRVAPGAAVLVCLILSGCTSLLPHAQTTIASATASASTATATATATAIVVSTAATGTRASAASSIPVAALHRPLRLPTIRSGQPCPVTFARHQPDPTLGIVQGIGPAGPVGLDAAGILQYDGPTSTGFADKSWGGAKVLWAVDSAVSGPVLVRGRQLNGPHELRFNDPAVTEMLLAANKDALPGGWRDYPGYTRLQGPGCYAYQVDTQAGSSLIVFRAEGPKVGPALSTSPNPSASREPAPAAVVQTPGTFQLTGAQAAEVEHLMNFVSAYNAGDTQGALAQFSRTEPVGFSDCDYTTQQLVDGHGRVKLTAWLGRNIANHDRLVVADIVDASPEQPLGALGVTFSSRRSDAITHASHPNGITPTIGAKVKFDRLGLITEFGSGPYGGAPDGCLVR